MLPRPPELRAGSGAVKPELFTQFGTVRMFGLKRREVLDVVESRIESERKTKSVVAFRSFRFLKSFVPPPGVTGRTGQWITRMWAQGRTEGGKQQCGQSVVTF